MTIEPLTIVLTIGLFVELLLIIRLEYLVCTNESGIFGIDGRVDRLTEDIMGSEESIKVLSDSVRKLNGVVKDLEQKQPKIEPKNRTNTRAFIAGWDADESEVEDPIKNRIVDICLNGTYEQKQNLIDTMTLQHALLGQAQQCIYPWHPWQQFQLGQLQSSAMPLQQCIYPWQQTPSGAILPLWYMNRNLEDM